MTVFDQFVFIFGKLLVCLSVAMVLRASILLEVDDERSKVLADVNILFLTGRLVGRLISSRLLCQLQT